MNIIAEKIVLEMSENIIEKVKTCFIVIPGEKVEDLLKRVGLTGTSRWHYDQSKLVIKLVKEDNI